jgi:hypothetical protein
VRVSNIYNRTMLVQAQANEVKGLTKPTELLVRIDGLLVCTVESAGIHLWSREYRAATARCECTGTTWTSNAATLRPTLNTHTRPTDAGMRLFGELAVEACEYVQGFPGFTKLALSAEKQNAQAFLAWQRRELLDLHLDVERLTERMKNHEALLLVPDDLTPDEHRLAAALIMAGHTSADAILAAKALAS